MEKLWRFWAGSVSGVVVADSHEDAMEKVERYMKGHFSDAECQGLTVWPCTKDDDYDENFPDVLAVDY